MQIARLAVPGIAAALGAAAWWWWSDDPEGAPEPPATPSREWRATGGATVSVAGSGAKDTGGRVEDVSVRPGEPSIDAACGGSPWSALVNANEACLRAMDRAFLDEMVTARRLFNTHVEWDPPEAAAPPALAAPTWREVFEEPEATRREAEVALARAECVAGDADPNECAADAVAAIALLQDACVWPLVTHGLLAPSERWEGLTASEMDDRWWWYVDRLNADPHLSVEEYWRKRGEVEEAKAAYAWRLSRCAALPASVLSWFPAFPEPDRRPGNRHQARHLYAAAARLGVQWAEGREGTF